MAEPGRPRVTIEHGVCNSVLERLQTHSQNIILIAPPRQQWLPERASSLRHTYTGCIVKWWYSLLYKKINSNREIMLTFIFIQHHSCYCPFCVTSSQSGLQAQCYSLMECTTKRVHVLGFAACRSRKSKFALLEVTARGSAIGTEEVRCISGQRRGEL